MNTITIELSEPVMHAEQSLTSLTFRKRKAKDLAAMDNVTGEQRRFMAMLASMANMPLAVIEDLDGDDYERIIGETLPLMGKSVQSALRQAEAQDEAQTELSPSEG